jgi:hypothetical protein
MQLTAKSGTGTCKQHPDNALSIPTCDEDGGGYVQGTRMFDRCEVYALAAELFVDRLA